MGIKVKSYIRRKMSLNKAFAELKALNGRKLTSYSAGFKMKRRLRQYTNGDLA